MSFEDLTSRLQNYEISEDQNFNQSLRVFIDKLFESHRSVCQAVHTPNVWWGAVIMMWLNSDDPWAGAAWKDARSAVWKRPSNCWSDFQRGRFVLWRETASWSWSASSSPCSCRWSAFPQPVAKWTGSAPAERLITTQGLKQEQKTHWNFTCLTDVAALGEGGPPDGF